jgi:iron complex outermembrane receptor protein
MRRLAVFAAIACAALLARPSALAAQSGTIFGKVADSAGAGIAHATLTVDGTVLRTTSNDAGDYELVGVPAGFQTVRARLIAYLPGVMRVTVPPGGRVRQNFTLLAQPIGLAPIDIVVGSRARHAASDEMAVPVDVFTAEVIAQQGTHETSQILQALAPSVNFPHQSVTDATDVVRPFTMRGLSPDHTLVLMNGWRRHQTALVNTFAYGTGAGSSGADLNTIPASSIERIEVLRDGASAQYGSDAIAGVVNIVTREGAFAPFLSTDLGQYGIGQGRYPQDGRTVDVNGGWGFGLGRGSLSLFAEVLDRQPTNRAWADPFDDSGTGLTDSVSADGRVVVKRSGVPQPSQHWGDGLERDIMTMANLRLPLNEARTREFYAFGGYSTREGAGQGYRRYGGSDRNWATIYPVGFLPEFHPTTVDYSVAGGYRGTAGGWAFDLGASYGHSGFEYNLRNTLNASLGPCLVTACAPGPDGIPGDADDPGIPNQTRFMAGRLSRGELTAGLNAVRAVPLGLHAPVNVAVGVLLRRETYGIAAGEKASWVDGGDTAQTGGHAASGSQVFPGFAPSDVVNANRTNVGAYADFETDLADGVLANLAGRFEHYSDFGSVFTGKAATRLRASRGLVFRAAISAGYRAPGLSQIHFSKVVTNVIAGTVEEIGIFPVTSAAAKLMDAQPLKQETSLNLSGGVAYTPADNLTFTADLYQIDITNRILLGATFADSATQAILTGGGINGIKGIQYFTNGLNTRTRGLDLTADLRVPTGLGNFQFTAAVNYTRNQITHVDPKPAVLANDPNITSIIDSVTYIAITQERPDWRGTLTTLYSRARFHALARSSYFGQFSSAQPGYCDLCREHYGEKLLFDAEVGYRFGAFDLSVGARNLFNTYPDMPSSTKDVGGGTLARDYNNNFGTFPYAAASPFGYNGRYVYARVNWNMTR